MNLNPSELKSTVRYRLLLIGLSFSLYLLMFALTMLSPSALMYEWVYLVFLPAGSKLICILLFGLWGTMGDALALFLMAIYFIPDGSLFAWTIYATVSSGATLLSVRFFMRYFQIDANLDKLQYWHIPVLSLFSSLLHALVSQLAFLSIQPQINTGYVVRTLAMTAGDFLGTAVVVIVLVFTLRNSVRAQKLVNLIQSRVANK